jgi:Ankyrin repeats (3 copies)
VWIHSPSHCCKYCSFWTCPTPSGLGAKGNLFDGDGSTPFSLAVDENQSLTAKLLIEHHQAHERRLDKIRTTSLYMVTFNNMEDVVIHLLKSKSDQNVCSPSGWTPVHVVANGGHLSIVRLLLKYGGKPDAIKSDGGTPLYLAAPRGYISINKGLFAAKAGLDYDRPELQRHVCEFTSRAAILHYSFISCRFWGLFWGGRVPRKHWCEHKCYFLLWIHTPASSSF